VHGGDRLDLTPGHAQADAPGVLHPLDAVDVRIFLLEDEDGRRLDHGFGQVGMRVQHHADGHGRADDLAHQGEDFSLAVPVVLRNHRPVQEEDDDVDRGGGAQIVEQGVAQPLVDRLHRRRAGLGEGEQARRHLAALGLGQFPQPPGHLAVHAAVGEHSLAPPLADRKGFLGGRDGGKGIGLGRQAGEEHVHQQILAAFTL
jgi:hypothetical protein